MDVIRFFAPVNNQTAQRLVSALDALRSRGANSVHLLLATTGGSTDAGIAVHNFIKASGLETTAVNMGVVASIGTVIFCAAARRISMPQARFTFHPNVFNIQNESLGVHQLQEKANQLTIEHEAIAGIIGAATGRSIEDAKGLILGHRSLSANEAREFGIVHEVEGFQVPRDAKLVAIDA